MSVQAWTGGDHYPGALAEVIAPPSLAWQAMTTATADNAVYDVNLDSTPSLQGAPWLLLLPTSTLTILQSTGGNTGDFTISSVPEAGEMRLSTDPGNGTAVKARVTPAGRNGLHDLAKRLQNGYTNANDDPVAAIPSTIIGGRLITQAAVANENIAPY